MTPRRHAFRRTVLVAGALSHDAALGDALAAFAERARVPLLADPLSNARRGGGAIAHYDLVLRDPDLAAALAPDVVCRVGELPTSKPLRAWLAGLDVPQIHFSADGAWSDPDSRLLTRNIGSLQLLLARLAHDEVIADASDWLERWRGADRRAGTAITATLGHELSEPLLAAQLASWLPEEATVFVASSMPIRDLESYQPVHEPDHGPLQPRRQRDRRHRLLRVRNRGLRRRTGRAADRRCRARARYRRPDGRTPHRHPADDRADQQRRRRDLPFPTGRRRAGRLRAAHRNTSAASTSATRRRSTGCGSPRAGSADDLRSALQHAVHAATGTTIIEVRTDREQNLQLHRRIAAAVLAAGR